MFLFRRSLFFLFCHFHLLFVKQTRSDELIVTKKLFMGEKKHGQMQSQYEMSFSVSKSTNWAIATSDQRTEFHETYDEFVWS